MEDLKGKKLLVLGGNALSCDIVTTAQKMGVYTIVTDWYDEHKSPAKKIADEVWQVSIEDYEKLESLIKIHGVNGIFTNYTDSYLLPYVELCQRTGLPCLATKAQINAITNKDQSKQLCMEHGIPVPKLYPIRKKEDIKRTGSGLCFPVLVKPVDQSGQRGIFVCNNVEELEQYYNQSVEYSATHKVIVEEYLQGDYVVMFYTIQHGHVTLASMADKPVTEIFDKNQVRLPKAYVLPSRYVELCETQMLPKVQNFVESLGIKQGVLGIEGIVKDGVIYVFEMQFRLGGMRHHEFVLQESGMNIMEMFVRFALTGKFEGWEASKCDNANFKYVYCLLNILVSQGIITKIEGADTVRNMKYVTKYTQMSEIGDRIALKGTVQQIFCKVSLKVPNKDILREVISTIHDTIKVYDDQGNNMVLNLWK